MINIKKTKDKYGNFTLLTSDVKEQPIVSIIMSAYNTSDFFLKKSIESVLNQTFQAFEFVIINDGADKTTSFIIEKYFKQDHRIVLIQQDNMGLTKSLNRGILVSKGKYIARQDTDDIWVLNKLENQLASFDLNKNVSLIGTQCKVLDSEFKDITHSLENYKERLSIVNTKDIQKAIINFNPFCHASILIKKDILNKVGLYNDSYIYTQDYELWIRVIKEYDALILQEPLTIKIFHNESITSSKRRIQRRLAMKAKIKAMLYFDATLKQQSGAIIKLIASYLIPEYIITLVKKR